MATLRFGPYTVETTNEDKVLFPEDSITKGDLISYYRDVAAVMLPHLRDRPLMMHRFPDGIDEQGFYQKDRGETLPEWVESAEVRKKGGTLEQVICRNEATLACLANLGVITLHAWPARIDRPDHPDRMVFDLDPASERFEPVREAARAVLGTLDELGLPTFIQTTGSKGLHVVVPLDRSSEFDEVREFAKRVAERLSEERPDLITTEQRREKRGDRVYVDVMRNSYAQTHVAPYSVRAKPGAPVATPLEPEELADADLNSRRYTMGNIRRRLAQRPDPWREIGRKGISIRSHPLMRSDSGFGKSQ